MAMPKTETMVWIARICFISPMTFILTNLRFKKYRRKFVMANIPKIHVRGIALL